MRPGTLKSSGSFCLIFPFVGTGRDLSLPPGLWNICRDGSRPVPACKRVNLPTPCCQRGYMTNRPPRPGNKLCKGQIINRPGTQRVILRIFSLTGDTSCGMCTAFQMSLRSLFPGPFLPVTASRGLSHRYAEFPSGSFLHCIINIVISDARLQSVSEKITRYHSPVNIIIYT